MKKFYVMNLNLKRIISISFAFVLLIFIAFYSGIKFAENNDNQFAKKFDVSSYIDNDFQNLNSAYAENNKVESGAIKKQKNSINKQKNKQSSLYTPKKQPQKAKTNFAVQQQSRAIPPTPKQATSKTANQPKNLQEVEAKNPHYTIQLGAFSKEEEAQTYVKSLIEKNIYAKIVKTSLYYIVCTGSSKTIGPMQKEWDRVKLIVPDSYIVKKNI